MSRRARTALAAAETHGQRLGGFRVYVPNDAAWVLPMIRELWAAGVAPPARTARGLARRGVPTPEGAAGWRAVQVQRVLERAGDGGPRALAIPPGPG